MTTILVNVQSILVYVTQICTELYYQLHRAIVYIYYLTVQTLWLNRKAP